MDNNHEVKDLKPTRRVPWNKGKLIGTKPPLTRTRSPTLSLILSI